MATLLLQKTGQIPVKTVSATFQRWASANRVKPVKKRKPMVFSVGQKFDSMACSLANRGYLRSQKPYEPSGNVSDQINTICNELQIPSAGYITDKTKKYALLTACFAAFQRAVPNSQLNEINSIGDVIDFYSTSVNVTVPLDAMKTVKLPENLNIIYEPHRFSPNTDTKFGGKSAFPRSSTIVTGLKHKKKFEGYEAKRSWP